MNTTFRKLPIHDETTDPCFFASISSVKTNFTPLEYLRLLNASGYPLFLISAYDLFSMSVKDKEAAYDIIQAARESGSIVLLDSGNYESYWHNDKTWTQEKYHEILKAKIFDLCMGYDGNQETDCAEKAVRNICQRFLADEKAGYPMSMIPIIHAKPSDISTVVEDVAKQLSPTAIALPERELGEGILARYHKTTQIRNSLDSTSSNIPLHILGTGNPLTLLVLSLAGANSFDGLEWCQTTVDPLTAHLHHFQHRELITEDLPLEDGFNYSTGTLIHNLNFYKSWISRMSSSGTLEEKTNFASTFLSSSVMEMIGMAKKEMDNT